MSDQPAPTGPPVAADECSSCGFSVLLADGITLECHRNPPTYDPPHLKASWPTVQPTDWCGEWNATP
jgi:hypothetical protein